MAPKMTLWGPRNCPHDPSHHCPLYVAMHVSDRTSCNDGGSLEEGCAVDRGADYHKLLGKLLAEDPRLVADADWAARKEVFLEQRNRNMRLNGVH